MTGERPTLKRFKQEIAYYQTHRDELLQRYPEEWVAIFNQSVVADAPDPDDLLATLKQRGIPAEHALVEHLTHHEDTLML